MNRMERPGPGGEARLRYLDGDYHVLVPGTHVTCAVTGAVIPLDELKYWSVERQEAYRDATVAMGRYDETGVM